MKSDDSPNLKSTHSPLSFKKAVVLLTVLGFAAYFATLFYPFVHDDVVFIKNNPLIADVGNVSSVFFQTAWPQGKIAGANPYYRPVLEILNRMLYQLFQFNPFGYHLFNVLIHIVNSILVYILMIKIIERPGFAFSLAAIFLLHPVQTQAVAGIAGVSNLLFTMLCLISIILYLSIYESTNTFKKDVLIAGSLAAFAAALLVKEQAIMLPAIIVLIELCIGDGFKTGGVNKVLNIMFFFIIAVLYMSFRSTIGAGVFGSLLVYKTELMLRLQSVPSILLMYFGILFFPVNLHYYRSIDILAPKGYAWAIILLMLFLIFLIIVKSKKKDAKFLMLGLGWFFIAKLPTLNIFPVIIEYSIVSAAEHFLYFPMIGFLLFILICIEKFLSLFESRHSQLKLGCVIMMSILFILWTNKQSSYWRGEVPLFERTVRFEKKIGRVHILMGKAYFFDKQYDKAIKSYLTAEKIMRGYLGKVKDARAYSFYLGYVKETLFDLAHCYEAKGNFKAAIARYLDASGIDENDSMIPNNIGSNYLQLGDIASAAHFFERAIKLNAKNVMAINNLAICYIHTGKKDRAEGLLRQALKVDSEFLPAMQNLQRLTGEHTRK